LFVLESPKHVVLLNEIVEGVGAYPKIIVDYYSSNEMSIYFVKIVKLDAPELLSYITIRDTVSMAEKKVFIPENMDDKTQRSAFLKDLKEFGVKCLKRYSLN